MVKLGWKAGAEQYPPEELLEQAIAAEAAGFDIIDVSDHFHPWSEEGQACFAWTWLGAVAARTDRIMLGTGVTCPILRYHPSIIAQAAATVDCLAPGRAYLGVGTGEALNEFAACGSWPEYGERQERLGEAIDLIRQLWTGEDVTFRGTYYETRRARLFSRSDRPIPIIISSLVPDSADFAGRKGDGLFTVGGEAPDLYKSMFQAFDEGAKSKGKDPSSMPKFVEVNVAYTNEVDAAVECMRRYWAGTMIPALFDQKIYTPEMSAKNGSAVGSDTIKKKMLISDNTREHVEFLEQYVEMGFTHVFIHTAGPDQMGFIERYGRDVLPKVRSQVEKAA